MLHRWFNAVIKFHRIKQIESLTH
uniref:Uncharacterized protein n=1 Tax=Arundo donax TaxID=35708 RepID=A0A0A8Z4Z3_ARUDO